MSVSNPSSHTQLRSVSTHRTLLTPNVLGVFPIPTNSPSLWTPTWCPIIQLNFGTNYRELVSITPGRWRAESVPPACRHPLQTPITSQGHHYLWPTGCKAQVPATPLSLLEWLTELRKVLHLLLVCSQGYNSGTARWKWRAEALPCPL